MNNYFRNAKLTDFSFKKLFKPLFLILNMKIHAIGGYNEVGKNMTLLEIGNDVFIFDAGLFLPAIVGVAESERIPTERGMRTLGALPNDLYLDKNNLRSKVKALLISHAHLDHVGAVPYIAPRYQAPVYGTFYTTEVLKTLMADAGQHIHNKIIPVHLDNFVIVKGAEEYKVEFITITHSTLQASIIAVHTKEGIVMYANDYKLDNSPVFGDKPNYKRLRELSQKGIKALIVDCLYAPDDRKTPSEKIAKGLLEDVLFSTDNHQSAIIITTFSSHIARLKTIVEMGRALRRKVIFLGRSLNKYVTAAQRIGKAPFLKDITMAQNKKHAERLLKQVQRERHNYLVVCTGHQGEPGSILDRLSREQFPFRFQPNDQVIFSSKTIPAPVNEVNKEQLEKRLRKYKVRIFDNVHVSGHGGREDLRDLIKLINPQHIIPSHGDLQKLTAGLKLAEEVGYEENKNIHLLSNGRHLTL